MLSRMFSFFRKLFSGLEPPELQTVAAIAPPLYRRLELQTVATAAPPLYRRGETVRFRTHAAGVSPELAACVASVDFDHGVVRLRRAHHGQDLRRGFNRPLAEVHY